MIEAPTAPLLQRGARASNDIRAASAVMEERRAGNVRLCGSGAELRCECGLPGCRELVPAVAASHRRKADRFVVVPAHLGVVATPTNIYEGRVVRVADRFFVVELHGGGDRYPAPPRATAGHDGSRSVLSTTTARSSNEN